VKPWFQGQVPFGPAVRDLATQGFPLEGGRLDYLDRQAVATLVYRARAHAINVFIWPGAPGAASALVVEHRDGVHAAHWAQDGLQVWAVSDVNEAELRRLVALLR
jgi:anti-sigma factor RsiW